MTESAFNRPVPVQEQQAALKAEPKTPNGLGINYKCAICDGAGRIVVEWPPSKRDVDAYKAWHATVCADIARDHAIHAPDCMAPIAHQLDIAKSIDEAADPAPTSPQPSPGTEERELSEAEASAAIEAAMQERIAEAIDNDLETRARATAIPVSGFAAQITERDLRVTLTAEQLEATKHLKPGEAWAKAGEALEPEPAKKPEDMDGF